MFSVVLTYLLTYLLIRMTCPSLVRRLSCIVLCRYGVSVVYFHLHICQTLLTTIGLCTIIQLY